jgi:ribosomal protein S27AE
MSERDYKLGTQKFPEQIELCGVCGRRVHRLPPDETRLYCEKCGQAQTQPTVIYRRVTL